jgi:SAM-dependent methyltransferase
MAGSEGIPRDRVDAGSQRATPARVIAHYESWPFPGVDHGSREGLIFLRSLTEWLTPHKAEGRPGRVIDVGCGTGHTIVALAKHFPEVEFIGVDGAEGVLDAARSHAESMEIENVKFELADIVDGLPEWDPFDVVLCLGVLHHVPQLTEAFCRVAQLVKRDGHLVVWLYGRFGRARHQLNQEFVALLAGDESHRRLDVARAFLQTLGSRFAVDSGFYTPQGCGAAGVDWLLKQPQWLADQMAPALEYRLILSEILDLFSDHSLDFVKWLGVPTELTHYTTSRVLIDHFRGLSARDRLRAIDYLTKPAYYFVAGRKIPA